MFLANQITRFFINHIPRRNQWNCLIFCMLTQLHIFPSCCLFECFLGIGSLDFSEFGQLCVTEPDFLEKNYFPKKIVEMDQKKNFSEFEKKFSHSFSMNLFHKENLYYLLGSCTNTIFGKNLVPEGIGQNALSQSDCWIFKTTISPQQSDERVSIFACWYKFIKIENLLKTFWLGMVKNQCKKSGFWTLKLTVFL